MLNEILLKHKKLKSQLDENVQAVEPKKLQNKYSIVISRIIIQD